MMPKKMTMKMNGSYLRLELLMTKRLMSKKILKNLSKNLSGFSKALYLTKNYQ